MKNGDYNFIYNKNYIRIKYLKMSVHVPLLIEKVSL